MKRIAGSDFVRSGLERALEQAVPMVRSPTAPSSRRARAQHDPDRTEQPHVPARPASHQVVDRQDYS